MAQLCVPGPFMKSNRARYFPSLKRPSEQVTPKLYMKGLLHPWWVSNKPPVTSFSNFPFGPGNVCLGKKPDQAKEPSVLVKSRIHTKRKSMHESGI